MKEGKRLAAKGGNAKTVNLFPSENRCWIFCVLLSSMACFSTAMFRWKRGEKLCKSRGVVPSWAATALLQAQAQQSRMAVQTRLSYSDRMNIKDGYLMARMPFRKASKAWWSCPLSCYTSLCSFLCDPLKTWATSLNFQDKTDPCVSHGTCSWHVNATFLSVQHVNIQGDEEKQKRRILIQLQIISHQRKIHMDLQ